MLKKSFLWGFMLLLLVLLSISYGTWRQVQGWLFEPQALSEVKYLTGAALLQPLLWF